MDMHLVWTTGRIFLKPVPRFLLEPRFWTLYLSAPGPCSCFMHEVQDTGSTTTGAPKVKNGQKRHSSTAGQCNGGLQMRALGFLFSYTALIAHESDFHIAKEKHLLPEEVTWDGWTTFVKELDPENIYDKIDKRFKYGEFRLSRLNEIYRLTRWPLFLKPYVTSWHEYHSFFGAHFTWLASATVYVVVVLTAMQVGLATDALKEDRSFQSSSYGFTIFAILGPVVTVVLILLAFLVLFSYNWLSRCDSAKCGPTVFTCGDSMLGEAPLLPSLYR